MNEARTLADALCVRINRRNVAAWLTERAREWQIEPGALMPQPPVTQHVLLLPGQGLQLTLSHPHAGQVAIGDADHWVIREARFESVVGDNGVWTDVLPFGLDAENDTPQSAAALLDTDDIVGLGAQDLAKDDRRQSFFLDDALVLEITWRPALRGIERVMVVRLGAEVIDPL